jgi:hypothetical protein
VEENDIQIESKVPSICGRPVAGIAFWETICLCFSFSQFFPIFEKAQIQHLKAETLCYQGYADGCKMWNVSH